MPNLFDTYGHHRPKSPEKRKSRDYSDSFVHPVAPACTHVWEDEWQRLHWSEIAWDNRPGEYTYFSEAGIKYRFPNPTVEEYMGLHCGKCGERKPTND